jgi:DNA-binding CsgD family transcriptional regulator
VSTFPNLMLQSMDGVFAIGDGQKVLFWNQACASITGISAREAVGSRCHEVLKGHDPNGRPLCRHDCPVGSLTLGGPPPSTLPMRITHQDGQKIQLCVGTMLMPSENQDRWTVVHVLRRGRVPRSAGLFACAGREETGAGPDMAGAAMRDPDSGSRLTTREREILGLLATGSGITAMSSRLHISVATVRNHIQRLMAKLDVHTRVEAVAYAHRHHLV